MLDVLILIQREYCTH